jgi:hypothetical protein
MFPIRISLSQGRIVQLDEIYRRIEKKLATELKVRIVLFRNSPTHLSKMAILDLSGDSVLFDKAQWIGCGPVESDSQNFLRQTCNNIARPCSLYQPKKSGHYSPTLSLALQNF